MRQYVLFRTFQSSLMMWGVPAFIVVLVGPVFLLAAWNSWEEDRVAGIVFGVVWWIAAFGWLLWTLRIPRRIEFHENGFVVFRAPLRTLEVHSSEISSIKPGGNSLGFLALSHSGGKIKLLNQFDDFRDFLTRLKQSNPAVELRGC